MASLTDPSTGRVIANTTDVLANLRVLSDLTVGSNLGLSDAVKTVAWPFGPGEMTTTSSTVFVPTAKSKILSISATIDILQGGAATFVVVKAADGVAGASATTPMMTGSINANASAYTPQVATLTSTAADLVVGVGSRVAVDPSTNLTTASGTIVVQYIHVK